MDAVMVGPAEHVEAVAHASVTELTLDLSEGVNAYQALRGEWRSRNTPIDLIACMVCPERRRQY